MLPAEVEVRSAAKTDYFAVPYPSISLSRMARWRFWEPMPFPFSCPGSEYFLLARNGIYQLARRWRLAGREILFPSYFHGVELDALLAAGVVPRFFRVDNNMRVDVDDLQSKITGNTAAVYLIHYLGFPSSVRAIRQLCNQHGTLLIEDCALSLLSCSGVDPLGTIGDAAIFCLYKTIAVPDGGVLVACNGHGNGNGDSTRPSVISTLARVTASLSQHHLTRGNWRIHAAIDGIRTVGKRVAKSTTQVGSNSFDQSQLRFAASRATLWLIRTQAYQEIVDVRRRNFLRLLGRLREISAPIFEDLPDGVCPLFYPIRVSDKHLALKHLRERGVDAVNFWSFEHPVSRGSFPEASELRRTVIELPCHQDLRLEKIDRIADAVYEMRHCLK